MPFNDMIDRSGTSALLREDYSAELLTNLAGSNPLMTLARKLTNMSKSQKRMPVLSALATAYFLSGDTALKQTTKMEWANKYIDAEELAVIVPIPEAVLDDNDFDIWAEVRPELEKAFNLAITKAVLYGTNIPATWTTNLGAAGIVAGATAAGHTVSAAAYTDLYEAILGESGAGVSGLFGKVEEDSFRVTGTMAGLSMLRKLRNVRDGEGQPIFRSGMTGPTAYALDGTPIYFPDDGSIVDADSLMISGMWSQLVYSMRQDITLKVESSGVIQDNAGNIVYNLFQQDMVALRAVMRLGFALPNPINRVNTDSATRYPFAVLTA